MTTRLRFLFSGRVLAALSVLVLAAFAFLSEARGRLDPSGIWFHSWTGSTAGTEWALVHEVGDGRYRLSDVLGNGISFDLDPDGALRMVDEGQEGSGRGTQTSENRASFDWRNWGMAFSSTMQRAPHTDASFPIFLESLVSGDAGLTGSWNAIEQQLSPTTGAVLSEQSLTVEVRVSDATIRFTRPDGGFDQGVFEAPDEVLLRVREPAPSRPEYGSLPGSETSRDMDVLGRATLEDGARIELMLFLQTRAKVSDQIQYQLRYVLTR